MSRVSKTIHKGSKTLVYSLYYCGLPFRCLHCHKYGHLIVVYDFPSHNKAWVRK